MSMDSKKKYTKEQKRKAKYIQENDQENAVAEKKAQQIARAKMNKQSGDDALFGSEASTLQSEKQAERNELAKNAAHAKQAHTELDALEQKSSVALRKKAKKAE